MAFEAKAITSALRKIKGRTRAHFIFSPKDRDLQPLLEISKTPIKGGKVSATRKQAKGRVFIGRVRKDDDDGVYVFSSKQPINPGHFKRAIKIVSRTVKLLRGARLESAEDSGSEGLEDVTASRRDAVIFDKVVPDSMKGDSVLAGLAKEGKEAAEAANRARGKVTRAERASKEAAEALLEAESKLEAAFRDAPSVKVAQRQLEQKEEAAEQAVDAYVEAADKLDNMRAALKSLREGGTRVRLIAQRDALLKQLEGASGTEKADLEEQLRKANAAIKDLDDNLEQRIQELYSQISRQSREVERLEQAAESATDDLDRAEEQLNSERALLVRDSPDLQGLQQAVSEASDKLDETAAVEQQRVAEHDKLRAQAEEAGRKMQARVDRNRAKQFLDKASKLDTVGSIQERAKVRKALENTSVLRRLHDGDSSVLGERLSQMGTTPEEFLEHLGMVPPGHQDKSKQPRTTDGPTPTSDEDAKKKVAEHLASLTTEQKAALKAFKQYGGDWKKVKEKAGGGGKEAEAAMETMKQVYALRKVFMDDALAQTTVKFMASVKDQLKKSLETNTELSEDKKAELRQQIDDLELVELDKPEQTDPPSKAQLAYEDGRTRRYRANIPKDLQGVFGESLTVNFFAPGSTNPTSDIDMQFICEENPTACTTLINDFREVCQDRMKGVEEALSEGLGEEMKLGSLAEVFDTNPYPAGFVTRPELGAGLHFSDTFTERSVEDKKIIDVGLSLIRSLESPRDGKEPVDKILKEAQSTGDPAVELRAQRALAVGLSISLRSQMDQARMMLKNKPWPADLKPDGKALYELLVEAREAFGTKGPDVAGDWADSPPDADRLKAMAAMTRRLQHKLHEIAGKDGGTAIYNEGRYQAFVKAQQEVEQYTRARDMALSEGMNTVHIARGCAAFADAFEDALAQDRSADKKDPLFSAWGTLAEALAPHQDLFDSLKGGLPDPLPTEDALRDGKDAVRKALDAFRQAATEAKVTLEPPGDGAVTKAMRAASETALEEVRSSTSDLGTTAFLLQGMALNNADEAYTSRGAIGEVVEANQMKREVVTTTGSALSSLEANAGFFHEHVKEEQEKIAKMGRDLGRRDLTIDTPAEDYEGGGEKLVEFGVSIAKYIERVAQAFDKEDSAHLREVVPRRGPHLGDPPQRRAAPHQEQEAPGDRAGHRQAHPRPRWPSSRSWAWTPSAICSG